MIWATWRMYRAQWLVILGVVAVFTVFMVVTGLIQQHAWDVYTSHGCSEVGTGGDRCITLQFAYQNATHFSSTTALLCGIVPALVGLLVGIPLVAGELEHRTNRLAWTQTITRSRWLFPKLAVGATGVLVVVGALIPLFWWWTSATQRGSRIQPANFDITGIVGLAYALFAFALGAAMGALVRRRGWAFAAAVPIYILGRYGVRNNLRAQLVAPSARSGDDVFGVSNNDWTLQGGFVPTGRVSPASGASWESNYSVMDHCQHVDTSNGQKFSEKEVHTAAECSRMHHLHYVLQFHPPSHYWSLQLVESALFCGFALALVGVATVAVRRWRT